MRVTDLLLFNKQGAGGGGGGGGHGHHKPRCGRKKTSPVIPGHVSSVSGGGVSIGESEDEEGQLLTGYRLASRDFIQEGGIFKVFPFSITIHLYLLPMHAISSTLSIHPINTSSQYTLSTYSLHRRFGSQKRTRTTIPRSKTRKTSPCRTCCTHMPRWKNRSAPL